MEAHSRTSAIILAGGRSTRLGRDKASEPLAGRSLLQHVVDRVGSLADEIVTVAAPDQNLPPIRSEVPLRTVIDKFPGRGPLGGIFSGLTEVASDVAIVVACDMPLVSTALLRHLIEVVPEFDVVMPVLEYPEPLHAVYRTTCIAPIRDRLESGQLKITNFLGAVRVRYAREAECRQFDPDLRSFLNANTEEDLALLREIMEPAD